MNSEIRENTMQIAENEESASPFALVVENVKGVAIKLANKIGKRGTLVICAVLLVGVAVLLNVLLLPGVENGTQGLAVDMNDLSAASGESEAGATEVYNYFEAMQLSRKQARDEAVEVLMSVAESSTAVEEMKTEAMDSIARIAEDIEKETNIETLILAKGFLKCVAIVNGDSASIIVQSEGLLPSEIAQISEIVYEQAGILPVNLKIIEKNV